METYFPELFEGIDRNASNITCGHNENVLQFGMSKIEEIAKTYQTDSEIIQAKRCKD